MNAGASNNALATLSAIDACLRDPLAAFGSAGGIGFVGPDVPVEVLIASGRPFGHLPWRADHGTPWADRWLESSFPYWSRSILEQWHGGAFDALAAVVFSRADDASQRLYYYVAELQRRGKLGGPEPLMFDIALIPRESSFVHTHAAVLDLLRALEVSVDALPRAIERANALRRRLAALMQQRVANGPLYERLARAALWSDPCEWIDAVPLPESAPTATRILLAGSMPPDERLHDAVEAAGGSIVAEAHALAFDRLGPEVAMPASAAGPARYIEALARHLRESSRSARAFVDRAAWIVERVQAARATAVVIWLTREDEALAWPAPQQQRALEAAGLPVLLLAARHWQAGDGALEQIMNFVGGCADASA